MDKMPPSSSSYNVQLVDIHEVMSEEEDQGPTPKTTVSKRGRSRAQPGHRSFSRQVSLETGFSVLRGRGTERASNAATLTRSGRSLGRLDSRINGGVVGEGIKKGDFTAFRTKSTLTKQNSLLPLKRETNEGDRNQRNVAGSDGQGDSVPAGRYFAALRGPELDQVKVFELSPFHTCFFM